MDPEKDTAIRVYPSDVHHWLAHAMETLETPSDLEIEERINELVIDFVQAHSDSNWKYDDDFIQNKVKFVADDIVAKPPRAFSLRTSMMLPSPNEDHVTDAVSFVDVNHRRLGHAAWWSQTQNHYRK